MLVWFGHESGIHILLECRLAHRSFEGKHLVGQPHRVAMQEIDL